MLIGCPGPCPNFFFLSTAKVNFNTVDIADNVESIYIKQALLNLSRTIDDPTSIPSQIDIAAGTAQTSNSVTPTATAPFSSSIARAPTGVTNTLAGSGLSIGLSDAWQQSWTISPITDGDNLRNLRALYRYVVVENANLRTEYQPALINSGGKFALDPYALREPHCVLCTNRLVPNPHLHKGWLYWSSDDPAVRPRLPPPGIGTVDLGRWGRHELYMAATDFDRGYLNDFVLFTMGSGAGPSAATTKQGTGGAASKRFELIIPQQIQPQQ